MRTRIAGIVIGIAAAALLAAAPSIALAKPTTAKKPHAAGKAGAEGKAGAAKGRHKPKPVPSGPSAAELVSGNASLPESQRLSIQSDYAAGKGPGGDVGWHLIDDPGTGARIALPEKIVPQASTTRIGSRWTSAQGQTQIETFRLTEASLSALVDDERKVAHRWVESSVVKNDFVAMSGTQGLKYFLVRAEAKGSELRGVTILYDQATEGTMQRIALAVASAFTAFPDPAAPVPGMRRAVEYGTAIVVGAQGALLTSAQLTDGCQAITVPGIGHAERIGADKASDLALVRLYGARHLAPASLADAAPGNTTAGLILVGVADPVAQAGGGAVTRAVAQAVGQGVEPTPKAGFSGAAAIDSRGRVVGMVDLKSAILGGGFVPALVPLDAIRNFLQAQGVAPPANGVADHSIDQSVLRIICVRK